VKEGRGGQPLQFFIWALAKTTTRKVIWPYINMQLNVMNKAKRNK